MVLLELVTEREANFGDEYTSLAEWSWQHYAYEKPIADDFDEEIKDPRYMEEMTTVYKLGLMCTSTSPTTRPSMKEVLQILHRCCPEENNGVKKTASELAAAPLLGSNGYLHGYSQQWISSWLQP